MSSIESSYQSIFHEYLNIVHVNIQSLLPKLDILETEMQYYDIVVLTETWLSQNTNNDDIRIPNFDPPYRKDRQARPGGGIAIYIKSGIALHKQTNLIENDIEALCIEVSIRGHKFLLSGFYRPPNSGQE
ncbi:MAG: endonuclease/exonuclease/phosphatase family protein, partial [Candidatus Thiodiazotropha sp.]